jgi:hypothetical protein
LFSGGKFYHAHVDVLADGRSGAEVTIGTMCVCIPELGVLFNRQSRPSFQPTQSILYGAKAGGGRSGEAPYPPRRTTFTDPELAGANPYLELDEDYKYFAAAGPTKIWKEEIPENSVRVQYDFRVVSQ